MVYVKHPQHGNKHIPDDAVHTHVADGWVVWPRPASVKAGIAPSTAFISALSTLTPEPIKRGPGRPKKVAK